MKTWKKITIGFAKDECDKCGTELPRGSDAYYAEGEVICPKCKEAEG